MIRNCSRAVGCASGRGGVLMRTHFVTAGPGCELRIRPSPPAPLPVGEGSRVRHGRDEIATWFDRLTMSGCASRNDRWGWAFLAMTVGQFGLTKWVRVRGRAIAYEIAVTSLRRRPESRACNLLDFRNETTDFGHWIPAFAGMTVEARE